MNVKSFFSPRRVRLGVLGVVAFFALAFWYSQYERRATPLSLPTNPLETPSEAASPSARRVKHYRSTMMPGEISPTPSKDSMGMDMVPVYETDETTVELSPQARAMAGVETALVQRRSMSREIRAVGKVHYNETTLANITSRVEGYIERLFVDFTGSEVNTGDHLVEIYSPDLLVAQQELLVALDNQRNASLVESARRKLLLWGLTEQQVDELIRNRTMTDRITLYAPISGTVTEKMVVRQAMVKPGEMLYRLANLDSVWVYLDLYEHELPWVQYGQLAELTAEGLPGQTFSGRIWLISPVLNEETRTINVLLNINNTGRKLKPGMFVSAVIRGAILADGSPAPTGVEGQWTCPMHPLVVQREPGPCPVCKMNLVQIPGNPPDPARAVDRMVLAVPVTAVIDSGIRKLVFVEKPPGRFSPVEILTGPRADDSYPVLSGLAEGDRVAVRGAFLLDSQFQIRGLPSLFRPAGDGAVANHPPADAPPAPAAMPASKSSTHAHRAPTSPTNSERSR